MTTSVSILFISNLQITIPQILGFTTTISKFMRKLKESVLISLHEFRTRPTSFMPLINEYVRPRRETRKQQLSDRCCTGFVP